MTRLSNFTAKIDGSIQGLYSPMPQFSCFCC